MASPFPFTSGQVLTAAQLNSIGEVTSFTPTISNYTRGNGTSDAGYIQINNFVYVYLRETLGSTSSISGALSLTLPVSSSARETMSGWVQFGEAGVASYAGFARPVTASSCAIEAINAGSTYATIAAVSSSVPFTWASGDFFQIALSYEAA